MANNVKPGDLAILINDDVPENIGAIVRVVEQEHDLWPFETGVMWVCGTEGRPLLCHVIETGARTGHHRRCTEFAVYDSDLRPISGLPLEDFVGTSLVA